MQFFRHSKIKLNKLDHINSKFSGEVVTDS